MTDVKIKIRNTPSYLKGLSETRARVDADVRRLQKIHDEIAEKLAEATAERNSCDCLIRKYDARLDPNVIPPINGITNELGRWRFKPQGDTSLDSLRVAAETAGIGVRQEVKRRGRPPKSKPVVSAPPAAP
jgi:hypothetical protein